MAEPALRGRRVLIDASVILAFYLPAEPIKSQALALLAAAVARRVTLAVPALARYEILNALSLAVRGVKKAQRLSVQQSREILDAFMALPAEEYGIAGLEPRILDIALRHERSAYDASYLAIAEHLGADLVTGDGAFSRAVRVHFPLVKFLADYRIPGR